MSSAATAWYEARIAHWTVQRDAFSRSSTFVSRLRLATFLAGVALIWWGSASATGNARVAAIALGAAALVAYAAFVIRHARILNELERAETALKLNAHGVSRLARDWNALPEVPAPAELDMDAHPYARDLDLFGHGSLTKWLGRPATTEGARRLWQWLLVPSDPAEIKERQAAIDELAAGRAWRETLAIEGALTVASSIELARFLEWAEGDHKPVPRIMRAVAIVLPLATWISGALFFTGVTDTALWLITIAISMVLSFAFAMRMYEVFARVTVGQRALERYATMLSQACHARWAAPALVKLQTTMCVGGEAPAAVAHLARLAGWSELRIAAAILHFPVQVLTMWDFHVHFAIERWRSRSGRHVRGWIDALGSADALAVLAMIRADEPDWVFPQVDTEVTALAAAALGHPLISGGRRVTNDVQVGPRGTLLLITGSNMSGKSTLLRAIGLNTVLAQAGAPVCASSFSMPPVDLHTSIRVQDSLELGLSYFMAALARLKQIVDAALRQTSSLDVAGDDPELVEGSGQPENRATSGRVLLYLLDEVLQGTNSVERGLAVRAVVRHLLDAGAIGVMTTHDLALASEEPLKSAARLVHFTEQVHADGRMTFDYQLRPGLATSTNALRLMQLIGIPAT
jgi:predicted ATPase